MLEQHRQMKAAWIGRLRKRWPRTGLEALSIVQPLPGSRASTTSLSAMAPALRTLMLGVRRLCSRLSRVHLLTGPSERCVNPALLLLASCVVALSTLLGKFYGFEFAGLDDKMNELVESGFPPGSRQ
jgi:hypothetical protein